MKLIIQLVLWVVIGLLAYLTFNSIWEPIQFNKLKQKRYAKVIERMKDIRDAELAYKQVTGKFAGDFDQLINFIDTAQFTITQRRDTTVMDKEYKQRYGVDKRMEIVMIDTLGYVPVKDSLFGDKDDYREMMFVPTTEKTEKFLLEAGTIMKNETPIPVFEAKVAKEAILKDQDPDLVMQEKQVVSVDAVDGAYITLGSMTDVITTGNWPTIYGKEEE